MKRDRRLQRQYCIQDIYKYWGSRKYGSEASAKENGAVNNGKRY